MTDRTKPVYPTKAQVARIVQAAREAGVRVEALEFGPDGTVRVLPAPPPTPTSAYDQWQEEQRRQNKRRLR